MVVACNIGQNAKTFDVLSTVVREDPGAGRPCAVARVDGVQDDVGRVDVVQLDPVGAQDGGILIFRIFRNFSEDGRGSACRSVLGLTLVVQLIHARQKQSVERNSKDG